MVRTLLLSILFVVPSWAQTTKTISCSNSTCSASFAPQSQLEKPLYSAIEVGNNTENIQVTVPAGAAPRSIRLSVNNGAFPGKNLSIDLSANRATDNAGNIVVIGDTFTNLTIKANGFSGARGKDASELCSERFRAGQYGLDAKNFFEQRRQADPSLTLSRCDRLDLNYLQSFKFTCDDPNAQTFTVEDPQVEVNRLRFRAQCSGVSAQDVCVKKRSTIACRWRHYSVSSCGKGCETKSYLTTYGFGYRRDDDMTINTEIGSRTWQVYCEQTVGKPTGSQCPSGRCDLESYSQSFNNDTVVRRYAVNRDTGATLNAATTVPADYDTISTGYYNDWDLRVNPAFTSCSGSYSYVSSIYKQKIAYDPTGNDCSKNDINVPEDPYKKIPFVFTQWVQMPEFGQDTLYCAATNCPVNSTVSEFNKSLEEIVPENGSNGTQQGYGLAFVYDVQNYNTQSIPGAAGAGGKNDIPILTNLRYCVRVQDARTQGENSTYAKDPQVTFRKYNWTALKSASGGNAGTPPNVSENAVKVYRKLDDSVRYLLSKELL